MAMQKQQVTFSEYQGNRMFNVQNEGFDRFPTSLGERKVCDVLGNIGEALEFLQRSGSERAKNALDEFYKHFPQRPKLTLGIKDDSTTKPKEDEGEAVDQPSGGRKTRKLKGGK
jgi:hypothetical protein